MFKACKSEEQRADMLLLLFGPRYDRHLLSYTEQVEKDDAQVIYAPSVVSVKSLWLLQQGTWPFSAYLVPLLLLHL